MSIVTNSYLVFAFPRRRVHHRCCSLVLVLLHYCCYTLISLLVLGIDIGAKADESGLARPPYPPSNSTIVVCSDKPAMLVSDLSEYIKSVRALKNISVVDGRLWNLDQTEGYVSFAYLGGHELTQTSIDCLAKFPQLEMFFDKQVMETPRQISAVGIEPGAREGQFLRVENHSAFKRFSHGDQLLLFVGLCFSDSSNCEERWFTNLFGH